MKQTRRLNSTGQTEAARLLQHADFSQESLERLDASLNKAGRPFTITHGDHGPYNLLLMRDGAYTVLDFEIAQLDWRAAELVEALRRFSYNRLGFNLGKMKRFLGVCRARFAVAAADLQLLPDGWTFLNVRGCIMHWHRYCDTRESYRLAQA